jgi:hypothetical protein
MGPPIQALWHSGLRVTTVMGTLSSCRINSSGRGGQILYGQGWAAYFLRWMLCVLDGFTGIGPPVVCNDFLVHEEIRVKPLCIGRKPLLIT